jgi:CSLREA domain-containing protein
MRRFAQHLTNALLLLSLLVALALIPSARPAYAAGIIVNTNADNTTAGDGFCTLREAITNANADSDTTSGDCIAGSGMDSITFAANYTITLAGSNLPDITDTDGMTITGNGASNTIIQAAAIAGTATYRIIKINNGSITLEAMTLRHGVEASGGGINVAGGSLILNSVTLSDNQVKDVSGVGLNGGGISINGGTITINNSTLSNNSATTTDSSTARGNGGAIFIGTSGAVTLNNSTISGNSARRGGGALQVNTGTFNINYSTIANNTSDSDNDTVGDGGGIRRNGGTVNLKSSIVAGNKQGSSTDNDCYGTMTSQGYNLTGNGTGCNLSGTGDTTVTPSTVFTDVLASLGNHGGSTSTHALFAGSLAIDMIPSGTNGCGTAPFDADQRSSTRPGDANCDIGAYEADALIVTKAADTNDGTCNSDCSLREAIAVASAGDTIIFDSLLSGATIYLASTLTLTKDVTIDGSALASQITISGDTDNNGTGDVRVFMINSSVTATLDSLVITKGTASFGGGIYDAAFNRTLTIINSTLSDNTATSGSGGAIKNDGALVVTNSTFSGNSATGLGGAIHPDGGAITVTNSTFSANTAGNRGGAIDLGGSGGLTITNSTFSANTATNQGGGVYIGGSTATVRNSTFSGNSASSGGGIYYTLGTFNYANTIIANSVSGGDCANSGGTLGTNTKNLVEDGSCSAFLSGDPALDSLKDNGGPTQTFALTLASPAVNAGDDTTCAASPVNNLDQRGVTRPVGAHCDIGAYEGAVDVTAPIVVSFAATSPSTSLNIPITNFTASDDDAVAGYLITTSSTQPSSGDPGWSGSVPGTYTVGGDGSYMLYPWVKDFAGNVSSVYGSPASVTVDTTPPTVTSIVRDSLFSNPTNASSVDFIVVFSESGLTGVDTSDFTLTTTGSVSGASVTNVSQLAAVLWTVTVNTGSGDGTIRLDVSDDDTIADAAGNKLGGTGTGNGNFTSGQTFTIDKTSPTVDTFTVPSPATSLDIPITAFTASDTVGVTGYKITEDSTPPSAGASGWTGSVPTTYAVASTGSYTLYPWAKDAAGNVSSVYGSPASITVCYSSITVTSDADSGAGTLRQAIADACAGATINFDDALSGDTIYLASTLTLTKDVTIDGSSLASQITLSGDSDNNGTGDVRVFDVDNNPLLNVTLDSLTITKGQATGINLNDPNGDGGAILNWAYLTITNSTFLNNSSTGSGGAINNNRPLIITNSTFSGNSSTGSGGGGGAIMNNSNLTITNSTFSGNTGYVSNSNGGALYNTSPNTIITNSTFSGNSATAGGAILTTANLTISNSTISGNIATYANFTSGLDIEGGTTDLSNTIIANSLFGVDCTNNATIGSNTHNLIEDGSCSPALSGDPSLGALDDNGGPTQTFALLTGSPAIDAGDNATCAASPVNNLDQRGTARPNGAHCDIGAYEYEDTTAPSVVSSARATTSLTNAASVDFIVTFSEGVSGVNTSDFSLAMGAGLTGASITSVSGGTKVYTVSVDTGSGSGSLRLDLLDDDSIADSAGNRLGGSGLANGNFLTGQSYTIDKIAPTASGLVAPNVTIQGGTTYSFTVSFSDNQAVDITSIDGSDIRVTGPGGFSQLATLVSVTPAGDGTPRTATYQITAPGGAWDSADSGAYTIAQEANQVFDSAGNAVGATSLGSFLVSLNYSVYLPLVVR